MKSSRILVPLAIGLALVTWSLHRGVTERRAFIPQDEDTHYLPRAGVLRFLALGHHELLADLVFIRTVNYFGAELTGGKNYDWLVRYIDTINAIDPHFRAPYVFGSRATIYNGLPITNEMVWNSTHFLEEGLKVFPSDWDMAFSLGCNFLNELQTKDPKEKARWRRMGGEWIRRAAIAGGGPPWLPNLAATILTESGETEAAIRYLEEAYLTTEHEESRQQILNLLAAKRRSSLKHLEAAREEFTQRWKRTLPYAPGDLFILLGDPPSPRLDPAFLMRDPVLDAHVEESQDTEEATSEH